MRYLLGGSVSRNILRRNANSGRTDEATRYGPNYQSPQQAPVQDSDPERERITPQRSVQDSYPSEPKN